MSSAQESHQLAKEVNRGREEQSEKDNAQRRRQLFRWSAAATVLVVVVLAATLIFITIRFGDLPGRVLQVESDLASVETRAEGFQGVLDDMAATLDGFLAELRKLIRSNN